MKKKILSIPNLLTFVRLALVPVLILVYLRYYISHPLLPAIVFFAAALTDVLDGFIARRYNMETDLGKVLDPLADKLFVLSMLVCFTLKQPSLVLYLLLAVSLVKEVYMVVAAALLYRRKFVIRSRPIGKLAAFLLNLGVFLHFFIGFDPVIKSVAEIILMIGLVFSVAAAVFYTVLVYRQTGGRLPPKEQHSTDSKI